MFKAVLLPLFNLYNLQSEIINFLYKNYDANNMNYQILLLLIVAVVVMVFNRWVFEIKRKRRRDYYREEYLKSDA